MEKIDKYVISLLALGAIVLFALGFKFTGYAVAVTDTAVGIGAIGKFFWVVALGILVLLLILVKIRNKRK